MRNIFKRDIFSKSNIAWDNKNLIKKNIFKDLSTILLNNHIGRLKSIKKRNGLEINSSNFKLKIDNKYYLLKKWSKSLNLNNIKKINLINESLYNKKKFVPKIIKIKSQSYFSFNNNYWTLFTFIKGNYYKGNLNEFKNIAFQIGILFRCLDKIKIKTSYLDGPSYFTKKEAKIIKSMNFKKKEWNKLFDKKTCNILNQYWRLIYKIYNKNKSYKNFFIFKQLSHFDLHPHNILTNKNKLNSFLDIESCKFLNPGFALAFACLKLCKQTIINQKITDRKKSKKLVKIFISEISKNYPKIKKISKTLFFFSSSEVLRRIIIILNLNLKGIKQWNKVLKIQIEHLIESDYLFN